MLSSVERILVLALHDERPVERLQALLASADGALDASDRTALEAIDPDGLRMTSLIVRKLRFERVLRGDPALAEEHESQPDVLRALLRSYAAAVPPEHGFPEQEARAFREFRLVQQ